LRDKDETEDAAAGRRRILWPPRSTRSALLDAGAAAAAGDVLFYLHADSCPPLDALAEIRRVLRDWRVGRRSLRSLLRGKCLAPEAHQLGEPAALFFTRYYYGGQGISVSAEIFRALGGHRDLVMADLDLSQRLKKLRPRIT
jgi:hypothetical protein